jgi:hypothetical protein
VGGVVIIEGDAEVGEVCLMLRLNGSNLLLGGHPVFFRFEHDRGTVGVIGTHINTVLATQFLEAHPDIRLDILQQMAQVDGAIGVRQRAGNKNLAGCVAHAVRYPCSVRAPMILVTPPDFIRDRFTEV